MGAAAGRAESATHLNIRDISEINNIVDDVSLDEKMAFVDSPYEKSLRV